MHHERAASIGPLMQVSKGAVAEASDASKATCKTWVAKVTVVIGTIYMTIICFIYTVSCKKLPTLRWAYFTVCLFIPWGIHKSSSLLLLLLPVGGTAARPLLRPRCTAYCWEETSLHQLMVELAMLPDREVGCSELNFSCGKMLGMTGGQLVEVGGMMDGWTKGNSGSSDPCDLGSGCWESRAWSWGERFSDLAGGSWLLSLIESQRGRLRVGLSEGRFPSRLEDGRGVSSIGWIGGLASMGGSLPTLGEVMEPRELVVEVTMVCWEVIARAVDVALVLGVLLLGVEVTGAGGGRVFAMLWRPPPLTFHRLLLRWQWFLHLLGLFSFCLSVRDVLQLLSWVQDVLQPSSFLYY